EKEASAVAQKAQAKEAKKTKTKKAEKKADTAPVEESAAE
ncbi:hypothetical protein DB43_CU00020, partial [Parachlamydia acanthamoebae]